MQKHLLPSALGIIITTLILLVLNQFTNLPFITEYALIFIIAGMFAGKGIGKLIEERK